MPHSHSTHRADGLPRLQADKVIQVAPRQLPEALLVALLSVHGPRLGVPKLREKDLHLGGRGKGLGGWKEEEGGG